MHVGCRLQASLVQFNNDLNDELKLAGICLSLGRGAYRRFLEMEVRIEIGRLDLLQLHSDVPNSQLRLVLFGRLDQYDQPERVHSLSNARQVIIIVNHFGPSTCTYGTLCTVGYCLHASSVADRRTSVLSCLLQEVRPNDGAVISSTPSSCLRVF